MDKKCYCVTGGAGFIASYLVKLLLLKGHTVHATLRDLGDESKTKPLTSLEGANERLKLFKADLLEEGSFDEAVQGCHGVFQVATPIPTSPVSEKCITTVSPKQEYLVEIVLKGTLNVLRTCSRTPSVERFVYTSSIAAASATDYEGQVMDESIWTPVDILRNVSLEHPIKAYSIAKTLAEQAAAQYGEEHGLKVVSILPSIVGGPFTVFSPSMSCDLILFPLTGNEGAYSTVKYVRQFIRSYPVVHIEDVCEAHILLMESPNATGRYFCSAASFPITYLINMLSRRYPNNLLISGVEKEESEMLPVVEASSQKLKDLGFVFKHGFEDIIDECVRSAVSRGFLKESVLQDALKVEVQ